jgi:hypothetical protein
LREITKKERHDVRSMMVALVALLGVGMARADDLSAFDVRTRNAVLQDTQVPASERLQRP